jgi:flagellar biosynthesis protein FlhG
VIPGASGLPDLADLPAAQRDVLLRSLLVLDGAVDLLLIDTGAGVDRSVVQFILAAGEVLIVTTPEPTAITDAYALMKVLAGYQPRARVPSSEFGVSSAEFTRRSAPELTTLRSASQLGTRSELDAPRQSSELRIQLVVNNVSRRGEGEITGRRLAAVAEQFLGRRVELVGTLPYDKSVAEAVRMQTPLMLSRPRSPAARAIEALGERLWTSPTPGREVTFIGRFFQQILMTDI